MKRFPYYFLINLLSVLICFAVIASDEVPKRGGILHVALLQEMWTMDAINIRTTSGERIVHDAGMGECLYDFDYEKEIFIPRLATALPDISNGGRVYTIPIRKGVKFHDGTLYDARAAAYSINRILDPANNSYLLKEYKTLIKSEATDDYTLKIILNKPDNSFMAKLASREVVAVSREAVEKYGEDFGDKIFVGTGPFKFQKWLPGDHLVVVRNPDYWKPDLPYLDKIIYKFIFEEAEAIRQIRMGEVQIVADITRKEIATLKADKDIEVKTVPGIQHEQIYLNTKLEPFNNIRVRQAVAHAIDRQAIIKKVFKGYAIESVGPYHPWFWTHNPDFKQPYPYDPKKAKTLLAEAGYGPKNPLKFELMATDEDIFVDQAVKIQAFMKDIGVKVKIHQLEKSTLFDRVYVRNKFKGKPERFQAAVEDWGSNAINPRRSAEDLYSSGSKFNKCFYANPKVDRLFEEVNSAKTIEEQKKIYYRTEELIARDVPTIWICNPKVASACRKDVKNFNPNGENRMPLERVWLAH